MKRLDQLRQMLQDAPEDTFLLYAVAMELRTGNQENEALSAFDRVLEVDPHYVAAYFQKAQLQAGMNLTDEARQTLRDGIKVANDVQDDHAAGEMSEFLASLA